MRLRVCVVTQQRPVAEGQAGRYCRTLSRGHSGMRCAAHVQLFEASYGTHGLTMPRHKQGGWCLSHCHVRVATK